MDPAPGALVGLLIAPTLPSPTGITVSLQGDSPVSPQVTSSSGAFVFDSGAHGRYNLAIHAEGFWDLVLYGLNVEVGKTLDVGTLTLVPLVGTSQASIIQGLAQLEGASSQGGIQVQTIGRPFTTPSAPHGG